MDTKTFDRLPTITAVVLTVLVIAACTIHLRGEDNQAPSATSMDRASDPLAARLEQCRSVTSEQPEALAECRKVWGEKRRQIPGTCIPNGIRSCPFSPGLAVVRPTRRRQRATAWAA